MDTDAVKELLQAYAGLVGELQTVYYCQDSDEIHRLEEQVDRLWDQVLEWVDGELQWKS